MNQPEKIILPKEQDLGSGFVVRRSLPNIQKKMVGPFVFWDHMGPISLDANKGMIVRSHPHIGLATITWLFSGEILHRDSLGNEQRIKPGEVNWMTAGEGIVHSERSYPENSSQNLEGIQLWLALPKKYEEIAPSFFHCKENEVPLINMENASLRLIAGEAFGKKSPVPTYSPLFYINGRIYKNYEFKLSLKSNEEAAVYIIRGSLKLNGADYDRFHMLCFSKGADISLLANEDSEIMIFGGEVFPEKRYVWWNFVATDKEKIERAKEKWQRGEFPKVINESDCIPLPEK